MLEVRSVDVSFGGVQALSGISIQASSDAILGIVGPNGSGKTTLFNVITGIVPPDAGTVLFNEESIIGMPPAELANMGITRTFQTPRLFSSLTIKDNFLLSLGSNGKEFLWKWKSSNYRISIDRIGFLLREFGLEESVLDAMPSALPYGQRRIIEIIRCLLKEPRLLLLDEPVCGLTESEAAQLADSLFKLQSEYKFILIIIEHPPKFVKRICRRLVVLNEGKVLANDQTELVLADEKVRSIYLGEKVVG
jgi:branched-chain amino acid transport system ATP-binding protein